MPLSKQEIEKAKFTFSIYDFEGNERIDATQLGNALRALGLCPTLRRISNLGGTRTRNEKVLCIEEFLAIYQDAKQDKEEGSVEEYLECLQGYDKDKSGTISVQTLSHLLQGYGEEKLDRDETELIIEECGQPYQDQVDYREFVRNLTKGIDVRIPAALLIQQARAAQSEADYADPAEPEEAEESTGSGKRGSTNSIKTKEEEKSEANKRPSTNNSIADELEEQPKSIASATVCKRESVKSKAENEDNVSAETEKTEGNKISRRDSTKTASEPASRRESSPDVSYTSNPGKTPRKKSSIKSGPQIQVPETSVDANNSQASEKSNKKSISAKRDSVKSTTSGAHEEREDSPDDDGTCVSEVSAVGKSITRTRDSQKSTTEKNEREASPDISWASEVSVANISKSASARSSLKVKGSERQDGKVSPDISGASDATTEGLIKSRTSLKSAGGSSTRSSAKSKKSREEVKTKLQQPLISLKTDGLFGK